MQVSSSLIADCKRGDRRAQFQLYQSCFSTLMGVCRRYKKEDAEAVSVLNMGFLKILKNLDKRQSHVPFEAWIRRIMINTVIDDFRKNRKVKELIEHTDFEDYHDHKDLVEFNGADLQFEAEELEQMIKRLPPVSQKVFNLFAIDGYNHKEIGEMLGISVGTSKWHLSSARKKLREFIEAAKKMELKRKTPSGN
ncbi:MAG: RNA polymerase sigma factor [Bacteroidota bacterium]